MTVVHPGVLAIPAPRLLVTVETTSPRVVDGEVVQECTGRRVGQWPPPCPWAITEPDEIEAIRVRVKWHRAPWWWRLTHPRPPEPTHLTPALPVAPSPVGEVA